MPKYIDLTGQKFGKWTVIEKVLNPKGRDAKWLCECECGNRREVLGKNLRNGRSTSCGCYKNEVSGQLMAERNKKCAIDITGERYGKLIALEPTEKRLGGSVIWKCLCDCGNTTYVSINNLRGSKPVRSCGCGVRSIGESKIEEILKLNNINFISEYKIEEINQKRFDFYLPDFNRLIEYDGEQHFKDISNWDNLELQQKRDKIKNEYALAHNIPLVRIPYWERDNITLEMIMGDQYLIK